MGTVSVKVTASDDDNSVNYTFVITVSAASNNAPTFDDGSSTTRSFDETVGNATVSTAASIGAAVSATDDDNDTLNYTLEGTDAAKFGIVSTSGQIQTKAGERYSHEAASSYSVTVKADDSNGGTATIDVTLNVGDVAEPPQKPARPMVDNGSSTATSLHIHWNPPGNAGRPAFTGLRLRHRRDGTGEAWTNMDFSAGGGFLVTGLDVAVDYEFQVRYENAEGDGPFSDPLVASTAAKAKPVVPAAPTVSATSGSTTGLDVTWTAPDNGARPAIASYDLRYRKTVDSGWTDGPQDETGTSAAITGLESGTSYDVQVRAQNSNGHSGWSPFGTGSTATPVNTAPTASDNTVTTDEDTAHTFAASDFDFFDSDGDTLAGVKITSLPAFDKGTLALDGTQIISPELPQTVTKSELDAGDLVYTPPANENGSAYVTFQFKVNDGTVDSASAYTMTIDVTAVNDAPYLDNVIPDQSATAGTAFSYTFPANTFGDDDGDTLTYTATKSDDTVLPSWLSFNAATRTFSGTPAASDVGTVSVKVTASDDDNSVNYTFVITVNAAANNPPTASDNTVTTDEDTNYTFAASDFGFMDDDGDTLASVKIPTLENRGDLELDGTDVTLGQVITKADIDANKLTFTPTANGHNLAGYAYFFFTVNDGTTDSLASYEMTINVTPVNDAPTVANAIPDQSATVGTAFSYTFPANTFEDVDDSTLTYTAVEDGETSLPSWLSFTAGTRTFSGTPAAADVGTVMVKVTASDDDSALVSDVFVITVSTVPNNAPTASDNTVTTNEDTAYTFTAADFNFADDDAGDTLARVKITSLPASGKGTLALDGTEIITSGDLPKEVDLDDLDDGNLSYMPPANENGSAYATFQFKVNDGTVDSDDAYTMTINVTPVNDAPTVANAIADRSATVDTAFSFQFAANAFDDVDDSTLTYTATKSDDTALPSWLTFTAGTRTFSGTPAAADAGTVSVKVTASDDDGASVSDTFVITVNAAVNNAATGAPAITGAAQVGQTLTADTSGIEDDDGVPSTLTYQWVRITEGDVETNIGANAGTYTLTPAEQGHNIRVDVSFTDDQGNAEGPLESGETWLVMPAAVSSCGGSDPWCATLTAGHHPDDGSEIVGFGQGYGSVSPATFTHDGVQYTVTRLIGAGTQDIYFGTTPNLPADGAGLTLHIQRYSGELDLALADGTFSSTANNWAFVGVTDTDPASDPLSAVPLLRKFIRFARAPGATDIGTEIGVRLSAAATNTAATGQPGITGAPQRGETLTATWARWRTTTGCPPASPAIMPSSGCGWTGSPRPTSRARPPAPTRFRMPTTG